MLFGVVRGWFICGVFIRIPIAGHLFCLGKRFMRGYILGFIGVSFDLC